METSKVDRRQLRESLRLIGTRLVLCVAVVAAMAVTTAAVTTAAWGQDPLDDPNLSIQERRDLTLRWLDQYLTESDLLRKEDMNRIKVAVEQLTPSQLELWLGQTKDLREFVESPKWQDTKVWLREFMRVQKMYSDAEIARLRTELINADSAQMLAILKRIQAKHDSMVWMHQASDKSRQLSMRTREENIAAQEAAASAARATTPAQSQPTVAQSGGTRNRSGYQAPGGLITSRQVARAEVWAQAWGPMWFVGGF
jgi:hypothetical protein